MARGIAKGRFLQIDDPDFAILETLDADADNATVEMHLQRLRRSAEAFGIPLSTAECARSVRSARDDGNGIIRLRLHLDGRISVAREAKSEVREPVAVCFSTERVTRDDLFLQHKTSWRPRHDAAYAHAGRIGCFDALLRNERGEMTEGTRTTLFVERDGTLWTPPLSAGALPGILRSRLVSDGRAREATLNAEDLYAADALYVGNSARGLLHAVLVER